MFTIEELETIMGAIGACSDGEFLDFIADNDDDLSRKLSDGNYDENHYLIKELVKIVEEYPIDTDFHKEPSEKQGIWNERISETYERLDQYIKE